MTGADIRRGSREAAFAGAEETDRAEGDTRRATPTPVREEEVRMSDPAPVREEEASTGDPASMREEEARITEDSPAQENGGEAEEETSGGSGHGESGEGERVDYAALAAADAEQLRRTFPELRDLADLTELQNPLRYAQLRDLGLTPAEAYLATGESRQRGDNRSHLRPVISRAASAAVPGMSASEMEGARELFPDLSDSDILRLYKRIHK